MRRSNLNDLSAADLVKRFAEITVAQDIALLGGKRATFNRLFQQMMDVTNELKGRDGDQRCLLMELYNFPNMQVRVQAAKLTREVSPLEARRQLEAISETHWMPQAGDAGMSLALMDGELKLPGL